MNSPLGDDPLEARRDRVTFNEVCELTSLGDDPLEARLDLLDSYLAPFTAPATPAAASRRTGVENGPSPGVFLF